MISLLSRAGKQIGKPSSACAGCSDSPPQLTFFLCVLNRVWLCDPMDYSPPGSSVHGISQGRILKRVVLPPPGDLPHPGISTLSLASPALAGGFFTTSATWEAFTERQVERHSFGEGVGGVVCILSAPVGFQSEPSCALQPGNQNYLLSASFCLTIRKL